jgi:hypothetical protein
MERLLKNIELGRAAEIAFDSLKESSQNEISDSLQAILKGQESNLRSFFIENDNEPYFLMNVGKFKVVFRKKPDFIQVEGILSGNYGQKASKN